MSNFTGVPAHYKALPRGSQFTQVLGEFTVHGAGDPPGLLHPLPHDLLYPDGLPVDRLRQLGAPAGNKTPPSASLSGTLSTSTETKVAQISIYLSYYMYYSPNYQIQSFNKITPQKF